MSNSGLNNNTNDTEPYISNLISNVTTSCEQRVGEDITEASVSGEILLMMLLLSISLGGGHYLKKLKLKYINDSLFATLIGLFAGMILFLIKNEKYINNITTAYVKFFLIVLLPPIIFESAYNMKKKEFFKNLGTILLFAFLGTLLSILFIGISLWIISLTGLFHTFTLRESLSYGSLISATDPVSIISSFKDYNTDPNFFQLVYGESILNDVVSIIFYETCSKYGTNSMPWNIFSPIFSFLLNIVGSTVLGYVIGFITAVFLKTISGRVRNIEKIEVSLMVILPWVSYLTAQMLDLSGIVSLLFNGIAHATYTKPNLKDWSKITVKTTYEGIAGIFETLIFIFLGIGFFSFHHPYNQLTFPFIIVIIILVLLGRMINIYVCTKIANAYRTTNKIDNKKQFFLWFAGVRGAMAFALSIKSKIDFSEAGPIFLVLTLIITSFTLLYSTLFLDLTLKKCDIINICEADNFEESSFRAKSKFDNIKNKINEMNSKYLIPYVIRENRNIEAQLGSESKREINENLPDSILNEIEVKNNKPDNANQNLKDSKKNEKYLHDATSIEKEKLQAKINNLFE